MSAAAPQLIPFHPFDSNDYYSYSPLSSGLPSPSFPSPIPLPRGRSPTPASSRHPSRQVSVRRLSSIVHSRAPSPTRPDTPRAGSFDILQEGDIIGNGQYLFGEPIQLVDIPTQASRYPQPPPADKFQVIRKLGTGSYAVVYLVAEIPESPSMRSRHFAVKCLSKANLSPEELQVQMFEATLHQSLPTHPNIVTLYQTLQTPSYLLLLLESVPGEDLFYFLEQSRDQHFHDNDDPDDTTSHTPPTPSLLSTLHPSHLLSFQRIKLITSMFTQMCNAVAACHERGVSHRDIKPENFIVTEGYGPSDRRVLVKLTDFGLATLQMESADVDCGSAPYMSYECRNNVAPTYATQPADVWSLGIVLINMLYHHNPWSDTAFIVDPVTRRATFTCPSFASFLAAPVPFFLQRFPGMTLPVADFLANKVFCLLAPTAPGAYGGSVKAHRVSAREFGEWVRALPHLMGQGAASLSSSMGITSPIMYPSTPAIFSPVMSRSGSINAPGSALLSPTAWQFPGSSGFAIPSPLPVNASLPPATPPVAPSPARLSLSLPNPPMSPVPETEAVDGITTTLTKDISTPPLTGSLALDLDGAMPTVAEASGEEDKERGDTDGVSFRSVSTKRRGKRGARKKAQQQVHKEEELQKKLDTLADSFEQLARQISRQTTSVSVPSTPVPVGLQEVTNQMSSAEDGSARLRHSPSRLSVSTTNSLTTTSLRSGKTTSTASSSKTSSSYDRALAKVPPPPTAPPPAPPVSSSIALETLAKSMSLTEERERAARSSNRPRSFTTNSLSTSSSMASLRKNRVLPPPPVGPPPPLPAHSHLHHLQPAYASPLALSKSPSTLPNALSPLSQSVTISEQIVEEESPTEHASTEDDTALGVNEEPARPIRQPTSVSTKKSWRDKLWLYPSDPKAAQQQQVQPGISAHVTSQLQALQPHRTLNEKTSDRSIGSTHTASETVSRVSRLMSDLEPSRAPVPKPLARSSEEAIVVPAGPTAPVPFSRAKATRSPTRSSESGDWRASASPPTAGPLASGASSIMSAAGTIASSTSGGGFSTRWSNSSRMSVSTVATSVSGHSASVKPVRSVGVTGEEMSWRSVDRDRPDAGAPPRPRQVTRTNVKRMDGMPNNLDDPVHFRNTRMRAIVGTGNEAFVPGFAGGVGERKKAPHPPPPATRSVKSVVAPSQPSLDTITEQRATDTAPPHNDLLSPPEPKKVVQRGQINSLAKMLSGFKTKGRD